LFKGVFSWEIRGSRFVSCAVRFATVTIAELYTRTVPLTKGVGGYAASVPGVQHGVEAIFSGVGGSWNGVEVTRRSMAASLAGL